MSVSATTSGTSGDYPVNPYEYTSDEVKNLYDELMREIQRLTNKPNLTEEDIQQLIAAVSKLNQLMQTGIAKPEHGRTYFLNREMLDQANLVMTLLKSVGIVPDENFDPSNPQPAPITPEKLAEILLGLQVLADTKFETGNGTISFNEIMLNALRGSEGANLNLQAMLATDFIRSVNSRYTAKLAELKEQLEMTKKIMDLLKLLQDMFNLVKMPDSENYVIPPTQTSDIPYELRKIINPSNPEADWVPTFSNWFANSDNQKKYIEMSEVYFKQTIVPIPLDSEMPQAGQDLIKSREELRKLLELLISYKQDVNEQGSVANALKKVLDNMDTVLKKYDEECAWIKAHCDADGGRPMNEDEIKHLKDFATAAAHEWVLDGRTKSGGAANSFQNSVSNATTSNQYLSETLSKEADKERSGYEQFQKIAITILQMIHRVAEQFIRGMSGR